MKCCDPLQTAELHLLRLTPTSPPQIGAGYSVPGPRTAQGAPDIVPEHSPMRQLEIDARERRLEDRVSAGHEDEHMRLCDLHTHLLGTGSHHFWVRKNLWDPLIFPPYIEGYAPPANDLHLPLVYNVNSQRFFAATEVRTFFHTAVKSWDQKKTQEMIKTPMEDDSIKTEVIHPMSDSS